jgi:hypothetical protein
MTRNILWLITFIVLIPGSCQQKEYRTIEKQGEKLEEMREKAVKIQESLQQKSGRDYLATKDRYYKAMNRRTGKAIEYLRRISLENRTMDELKKLIEIANIAHDEQYIISTVKTLFNRYPESKTERPLIQLYFSNAYLLEPGEVEKYVTISIFPPDDQLYCYFMLALGFAETRAFREAKVYYRIAATLLNSIVTDPALKNKIPLLYIVGLRTFILYRIGDMAEAYNIITAAYHDFPGDSSQHQLDVYQKRLHILGGKAPALVSDHVIGEGTRSKLLEQKGKVILLYFFTWDCQTCTTNLPFLFRLQERIDNDNFIIIGSTRYVGSYEHETGISENQEYEYMKEHYYKKRGLTWPVCISSTVMHDFGIDSVPTYILIDKAGIVQEGYYNANFSYLERTIRILLEE